MKILNIIPDFLFSPESPTGNCMEETNRIMEKRGYELKYDHRFHMEPELIDADDRFRYFLRAYRMPVAFRDQSDEIREAELLRTRLALRNLTDEADKVTVFSFYPMSP